MAGLGLIAGGGALPRMIAEDQRARGAPYLVVRFEGADAPWADAHPHADLPYERPGALFRALRAAGCDRICFAGAVTRPRLNPLRFDLKALALAPKAVRLMRRGDDEMLRGFAALLEAEGFRLVAAQDLLDGLLAAEGVLAGPGPGEEDRADAARAAEIVAALGAVDVGQAAVVARGLCLAIEAIEGTEAMLARVAALPPGRRPDARPAGVLYKAPKPGQDRRMDLPAIGPDTVRAAAEAGLAGVAAEAGGVLILDRAAAEAEAARLGVFLWSRPRDPA